jgi:iron complex outermembrane receptor protein
LRKFKKTAIAAGIAQIAFLSSSAAWAQSATGSPAGQASGTVEPVVVISGQRAALQSAQKIKQDADEVVDSIVAEDIGKLPDRSITEVLSRIVGVTMDRSMQNDPQHSAVEGSGIAIRGLTYVRSELNGRESFSANGGRSLSFSDVPPELMAGVDVYKNPSAEQIEGGASGLVNLRTAMPFDFKGFKGSTSLQSTWSKLREGKAQPSGSLLLSNRWVTPIGEIGALVDLASSISHTRTDELYIEGYYPRDNIQPGKTLWVPKGAQWRSMNWERDRKGQYAAFQWRPIRDLTTSLTYFRSKYKEGWSERALLSQHTTPYDIKVADATWSPAGGLLTGTLSDPDHGGINFNTDRRVSERNSSTTDLALNVQWRVAPAWTVKTDFQVIRAKSAGFDSDVATGVQMPQERLDLTGKYPQILFSPADVAYLADPSKYYWGYTMEHLDLSTAQSKAWKTDIKYDFDHPVLRDIRFGVRLTERDSLNQNSNPSYNWQAVTQPWMLGWNIPHVAYLNDPRFAAGATLNPFTNFFGGKAQVPGVIFPNDSLARDYPGSYATLHTYHDILCKEQALKQGWGDCPSWTPAPFANDPAGINSQEEKTKAFYTQLRFGWDALRFPIDGNIGLRYVKTDSTAFGYTVFKPNLPTIPPGANVVGADLIPNIAGFATKRDYDNSYHNLLPSLNLRMKVGEQLQFRLALASSMARPDFSQLQGYTSLSESVRTSTDQATGTVTVNSVGLTGGANGNANLRPTTAKSMDLTAEWYFAKGGSLTFAVFNKQLNDIIVNQLFNYDVKDVNGKAYSFQVTGPVNGAHGHARGFEIAYQQYFDNLPPLLKGLGTQASLTFVDSKRKLNNPVSSAYCSGGDGADNVNLYVNGCDIDGRTFGDLPLQGLSRKTINLAVMYDHGPISSRLAYNWRSRYLAGVNNWGTRGTDGKDTNPASANFGQTNVAWGLPLWQEAYGQLDASIFYNVTPKLRIGLEAQNLTDSTSKQSMEQHIGQLGHAWFVSGPRYTVQAQYSF